MLEIALKECSALRISLIKRSTGTRDAVAIATAFTIEASTIYRELGGNILVAAQFYSIADHAATDKGEPNDH